MLDESLVTEGTSEGIEKFVVGAVIHQDFESVLIVTRSPDDDFLPGMDEVPSGGVDAGESLLEALDRELTEEVGFPASVIDPGFVTHFDYLSGSGRKTRQFTVSVPIADSDVRLSSEHSAFVWIGKEDLKTIKATPEIRTVLNDWFAWVDRLGL